MFAAARRVAAFALLTPLAIAVLAAPAGAQSAPVGVGTGTGSSNLLSIDLGSLLQLSLVDEGSSGTIDPANGVPTADEQLNLLTVHSQAVPALEGLTVPLIETHTTGGTDTKGTSLLDLGSLPSPLSGLLSGQINPATLTSLVDPTGAASSLTTSLDNLAVLGGLLHTGAATAQLGSSAKPAAADAGRFLGINQLTALDLNGFLQLLGLSLDDLPVDTLLGLVSQLGLPLDAVTTATGLNLTSLSDLNSVIDGLQTTISGLAAQVPVCSAADPVLVLLGLNCTDVTATLNSAIDALQSALSGVRDLLGGTALLAVDGINVGELASATDTVDHSAATTTGTIGHIRVGGLDLGAIDLNSTLDQLQALATSVTTTVNSILASISPSLGNLVQVHLFDRGTSITSASGYTNALAAINALSVTVTPPDICALLGGISATNTISSVLATAGAQALPALPSPVGDLLGQLTSIVNCGAPAATANATASAVSVSGLVNALTQPLTVKALTVSGAAAYTMPAAPATPATPATPTLPRTGGDSTLYLVLGAALVMAAVSLRRITRRREV